MKRDIKKLMALMIAGTIAVIPMAASAEVGGTITKTSGSNAQEEVNATKASGVVQSVDEEEITVNTKEFGLGRFVANNKVSILDENGKKISTKDLKAGMTVEMTGDFSIAGASLPPFFSGTATIAVKAEEESKPVVVNDKYISSKWEVVEKLDGQILVKKDTIQKKFNLGTMIIGTENGNVIDSSEIKVGDTLTALYTAYTPEAMSEPGIITPLMIVLHNSDNNVIIDKFDDKLLSSDKNFQLVVDDKTAIEAFKTKQILKAEDLKNNELVVIYGATTRSIPPQTLPASLVKVIVMPKLSEESTVETGNSNSGNKGVAHEKVSIAKEARALGYKVNWNPKTKTVTLTKNSETIEIMVGSTKFKVNGVEKTASAQSTLDQNTTLVSSEILDYLKK